MSKKKQPPAPNYLSDTAREWWGKVLDEYDLEPSDLKVMEIACVQWDRASAAREAIAESEFGSLTKDRFGQLKPHPSIEIEANATRLFLASVRQLGLGLEGPSENNRLPDFAGRNVRDN